MRKGGYNLGGEQSGHLVFLDHASTGDGIIGALQVLALMMRTGRPLSELSRDGHGARAAGAREREPARRASRSRRCRRCAARHGEVEKTLGSEGRVLVRWSGTEAKLRIMLEGPDLARIEGWAQDLAAAARRDLGGLV